MLPQTLDLIFPFFVLTYGFLLTVVLNIPFLMRLAEERLSPQLNRQITGHRVLAIVCLVIGSIWSLQTMWLDQPFFG